MADEHQRCAVVLSFHVTNLLIPGDPKSVSISLSSGIWTFEREPGFNEFKAALLDGQCAETYSLQHPMKISAGAAILDDVLAEITPLLLGASYLTGRSVTIRRSKTWSEVQILQPTEQWPRARSIAQASAIVGSEADFCEFLKLFVDAWPHAGQSEKALLLVHHWLDALACWSMEDLYLSATTLLQIVVATEAKRRGKRKLEFYPGIIAAAESMRIRVLSADFKNMRNELIHDGCLIGRRFRGQDKEACAAVATDVLNWFDIYIHAALALGSPRRTRFEERDLAKLNAYSIS